MAPVFGAVMNTDVFTEYAMRKQMFVRMDVCLDKEGDTVLFVGTIYQTSVTVFVY